MNKLNKRDVKKRKNTSDKISMLTCYDYQNAKLLNESKLDMILVGDSVGNVVLGYETTVQVTLEEMIIFAKAVKRGAPDKFIVVDLPFGTYTNVQTGVYNAVKLFRETACEAIKFEGAYPHHIELVSALTKNGIPVVGHIGLVPQSVHQMGGYYTHGKTDASKKRLMDHALALQSAGAFCLILECIEEGLAQEITQELKIPTIGIGSGQATDGQVLVLNDLFKMGPATPPSFCKPIIDLYATKQKALENYLNEI